MKLTIWLVALFIAWGWTPPKSHEWREQHYAHVFSHDTRAGQRCLIKLWDRESDWNPWAVNPYSGAYGIPQALGHGHPYPIGEYRPQIRWGVRYIRHRYSTMCRAWSHEVAYGWY